MTISLYGPSGPTSAVSNNNYTTLYSDGGNNVVSSGGGGGGAIYTINAGVTTGGANLNLVGSNSSTSIVKFAAGANINIVATDSGTITISAGTGGSTFGNITVAVVDNNTISTTTGDLKLDSATGFVRVNGDLKVVGGDIGNGTFNNINLGSLGDVTAYGTLGTFSNNLTLAKGTANAFNLAVSVPAAASQSYTLPLNYPAANGYVLSSTTGGVLSWAAATTNTTYTYNSTATTGGANLNLNGSDLSVNTVKLSNGTGVTVANVSGTEASISIGQDVATTANPTFAGATLGNITVGVATDNTITTTTGNLILDSTTDIVAVNADLQLGNNIIKNSTGNTAVTLATGAAPTVTTAGNLYIAGGFIKNKDNTGNAIEFLPLIPDAYGVKINSFLTVGGNQIKNSTGNTIITMATGASADTTFAGDIQVSGNDIKMSGGTTALTFSGAGDVTAARDLIITRSGIFNGSTSGTVSIAAPAIAGTQSYTLPTALPAVNGYALVSTTGGILSWAATTNTTYDFNASSTTGGANLNLVGSDSTTDTVKLSNGTGVTVSYVSGTEVSVAIGQDVATTANPTFAGATLGNITVGVATDNTITTTTGNLILDSTTDIVAVNADLQLGNNVIKNSTGNTAITLATGTTPQVTMAGVTFSTGDLNVNNKSYLYASTGDARLGNNLYMKSTVYMNDGQSGVPTLDAALEVVRGSSPNTRFQWNESLDRWQFTNNGTTYVNLPVSTDSLTYAGMTLNGSLRINGSSSGYSQFSAPTTGSNLTYVLPGAAGAANTVLTNDGSGNLSWALPGGGGSTFGNITVGIVTDNTISTTTGDLDITSTTGQVNISTNLTVAGDIQVSGNDIKMFGGTTALTFSGSGVVKTNNNLIVGSGNILGPNGFGSDVTYISMGPAGLVTIYDDLKLNGNDILASDGNTNITLTSNTLTTFAGDIQVSGNDIKMSAGTTALTFSGAGDVTAARDLIITRSGIFNGSTSGTVSITAPAIAGTQAYTLPTALPGANGYILTSSTSGTLSWTAPSAGVTYTYSSSAAVGGSNLNLNGSDLSVSTVKLSNGTGVTVANVSSTETSISIGQDVAITATPTFGTTTLNGSLQLNGATSGYVSFAAPAIAGSQAYTLPIAYPGANGYILTSSTGGTLAWTAPSASVTYTVDASTTTGGANFNLTGSDLSVDTIKFANGSNVTVTATDANTITIAATDTNTTYDFNASSTTGGVNLNLVGSDSTTDTVKLSNGTGVTVSYVSGTEASIAIGQDVATTASPTFVNETLNGYLQISGSSSGYSRFSAPSTGSNLTYVLPGAAGAANTVLTNDGSGNLTWALPGGGGSTFGNVTVGVVTDNTISTTTGDLDITSATGVINLDTYTTFTDNRLTTTSVSTVTLDSLAVATYQSASYTITIKNTVTGATQFTKIDLLHDGSVAYIDQYSNMASAADLSTFSATISGGNAVLQITPASTNSTQFTFNRIATKV